MKARRVPNGFGLCLARNRRSPKRPSEPRPSGVHPEEAEVGEDGEVLSTERQLVVSNFHLAKHGYVQQTPGELRLFSLALMSMGGELEE